MPGHGGLADPLADPDHRERRNPDRLEHRRHEPEVRADVRQPERERPRGPEHPLARPEHRLVGQVDDYIYIYIHLHRVERSDERHAIVLAAAKLLRPTDEKRRDDVVRQLGERVAHDRRVVLAVDEHERPRGHEERTSSSIRAVYFS